MARTALTKRTMRSPTKLRTEINSHKTTLDGIEAGTSLKRYLFTGRNGAGACTLTGAAVGDKVCGMVINETDVSDGSSGFEATITVVDQIQQSSASDLSTKKFSVMLIRPVS
jgi:hypothetical protein